MFWKPFLTYMYLNYSTKTSCLIFTLLFLINKSTLIINLMSTTRVKFRTGACLPLHCITFFWYQHPSCWRVEGGILCHSCLLKWLWLLNRPRSLSNILRFIMHHTFPMGNMSGLQTGQSITHTSLIQSHTVARGAEVCLLLTWWNKQGGASEKIFTYLSALMVLSRMLKTLMPRELTHLYTITDAGFWSFHW